MTMRKVRVIGTSAGALVVGALLLVLTSGAAVQPTASRELEKGGCCSWHGGVCGCEGGRAVCCDGTLSPSCGC